ncbi:MAG: prepilin-type N-terminal cleavage/methylation domain-containing protein [Patescibacteria group bacterium]
MNKNLPQRGYSLLELIVSLAVFSMVMLVVMGAYLTLISLDRQARASNQLAATLNFSVESMARTLRTGTEYDCGAGGAPQNCTSGADSITFMDSQNRQVSYRLMGTNSSSPGSIGQCSGPATCTDANAVPLTDRRIQITTLDFYVRGVGRTDYVQPSVTFVIAGTMTTDAGETTSFAIQTGASQRFLEL